MTDSSNSLNESSTDKLSNKNSVEINKNKEADSYDNLKYEDLIELVKEKQKELSVVLNEIDNIKEKYEKIYNEKQAMQEYIGSLMEIQNKSSKQ